MNKTLFAVTGTDTNTGTAAGSEVIGKFSERKSDSLISNPNEKKKSRKTKSFRVAALQFKFILSNKLTLILSVIISLSLLISGCGILGTKLHAQDLMKGISSGEVTGKLPDDDFITQMADFSFRLLKESCLETKNADDNVLISPLSVMLALSMTANGAAGNTKDEMEKVLGNGLSIKELNKYLYSYSKIIDTGKNSQLNIANSIWFKAEDEKMIEKNFLQTNADYYNAGLYAGDFGPQTIEDMNKWTKSKTNGMIDEIIKKIEPDDFMFLLNAVAFDAKWEKEYEKEDIYDRNFYPEQSRSVTGSFMKSSEEYYISTPYATGFLKPYKEGKFSFMALLPVEGTEPKEIPDILDGNEYMKMVTNISKEEVIVHIPKFNYDASVELNKPLIRMGMPLAFSQSEADFTHMGRISTGNIFIGEVLHKTYISLDEHGTKAAAVTKTGMICSGIPDNKIVILDRPFLYGIIDNDTMLPIFIGILNNPVQ